MIARTGLAARSSGLLSLSSRSQVSNPGRYTPTSISVKLLRSSMQNVCPTMMGCTCPAVAVVRRFSSSSVSDYLSDLLRGSSVKRPPRHDELNLRRFEVTRLNDVLVSGLSDVAEAASGPASAVSARNAARARRSRRRWADLLRSVPSEGGWREKAAAALDKFETKEAQRSERLGVSIDAWRERKLGRAQGPSKETYTEKFLKLFRTEDGGDLKKVQAQRFENESELIEELKRCNADIEVVREVMRGVGADIISLHNNGTNASKTDGGKDTSTKEPSEEKFVYVLDFRGDVQATQTPRLAEEISALLSLPLECRPTEVVLRLKSSGGTVTGYGLAAAQLMRLVDAKRTGSGNGGNIPLTVCVDEVAASGGYLMACTASRILCSPFAAIGSIGVVTSTPNVAKRLESEGLSVVQKTAGKYKRTVTPWKEPEPEELEKLQRDVDDVQRLFVGHIMMRRGDNIPGDVDEVATGEVWFGSDALDRGLVDEIMTSEEYIQNKIHDGCEVLKLRRVVERKSLPSLFSRGMDADEMMRRTSPMLHKAGSLGDFCSSAEGPQIEETLLPGSELDNPGSLFPGLNGLILPARRKCTVEALFRGELPSWR
mmetsp:Transcript_646/g.1965  ORF Transcript_646/g.1965 Transcript_646/m.1965 type:complete len:600 (-) Transcript_646:78-1877(-)